MRGYRNKIALFLALTVTGLSARFSFADPPNAGDPFAKEVHPYFWDAPRQSRIIVNNAEQDPASSTIVHVVDDAEWSMSVLFGLPELYQKSKGIIIMIPGMGGNVAKYGVAGSTKTFANIAVDEGFYPVSIQNRIYTGALDPNFPASKRREIAHELMKLDVQLQEDYATYGKVIAQPFREGKEVWMYGRSNGTAKILEMLDRACRGDEMATALLEKVDGVLVAGLNSHLSPGFNLWTSVEDRENDKDKTDVDEFAKFVDRRQYRQMKWALNDKPRVNRKAKKLPKVIAVVSAQDHYVPLKLQIETITTFARMHPQLEVEILFTPTKHDPTSSFKVDEKKTIRTGKMLRQIIREHFRKSDNSELIIPDIVDGDLRGIKETYFDHYLTAPRCVDFLKYPELPPDLKIRFASSYLEILDD